MEQGDTPESRSTAFHYQHVIPGAASVGRGAQGAAAHVPAAQPGAAAEQLRGGVAAGTAQQQPQQQGLLQQQEDNADQPVPPAFVKARERAQAVQAAGQLPTWTGTGTAGTASHRNTEGTGLWPQCGKADPTRFVALLRSKDSKGAEELAKMLGVLGQFSPQQPAVLGQLVMEALQHPASSGQLSDSPTLYLCLHLLPCYQSPTLPVPLLHRWEEAGVVARGGGGGWVPVLEGLDRYLLVIKVLRPKWGWHLSQLKFSQMLYSNAWLRQGLGMLGLRLWEGGDADGAVVCSVACQQYVYTPFGASLWHDSMQALFSSLEAARGLQVQWITQEPSKAQLLSQQVPDGWQLSTLEIGEQAQQGA